MSSLGNTMSSANSDADLVWNVMSPWPLIGPEVWTQASDWLNWPGMSPGKPHITNRNPDNISVL